MDGTGSGLRGYRKILFCGQQAKRDGLHYFWVDTCCVDFTSPAEHENPINSLFSWYRDAARCYVYLEDVSIAILDKLFVDVAVWQPAFRKSRWFTRAWTLPELLAPACVEFFSSEGHRLGTKKSLQDLLQEITKIPHAALQGASLSEFSVRERLSWTANRRSKCGEDQAYCLLGIFDVQMPLIYGEGRKNAMFRLRREIEKRNRELDQEVPHCHF